VVEAPGDADAVDLGGDPFDPAADRAVAHEKEPGLARVRKPRHRLNENTDPLLRMVAAYCNKQRRRGIVDSAGGQHSATQSGIASQWGENAFLDAERNRRAALQPVI